MTLSGPFVSCCKRLRLPIFAFIGLSVMFSGCQQAATVTEPNTAAPKAVSTRVAITPAKAPTTKETIGT